MSYTKWEYDKVCSCPIKKYSKGKFFITIVTSGKHLHWPYSAKSPPPYYLSQKDCEKVIKDYVKFANTIDIRKGKQPRFESEFEVVKIER